MQANFAQETPRVSVVVPVRDRRALLARLLDALDRQTFQAFEVVVVDDGSSDGSGELAAARVVAGVNVRTIRTEHVGAVAARTAGVAAARGSILGFTDSDCVPAPAWIAVGVEAIDGGADVANGLTRPSRPPGPGERSLSSGDEGLYPTCNVFYRRAAFEAAGGFEADVSRRLGFRASARARGLGFGEDTILGWRVRRAGRAVHVPEALVEHQTVASSLGDRLSRLWQAGAFPALIREVPELRCTLVTRRVRLGTRDRLPFYATVASLLFGGRGIGAAAVAWWAAARFRDVHRRSLGPRATVLATAEAMVEDAVTGSALVAGSIRARTLLL